MALALDPGNEFTWVPEWIVKKAGLVEHLGTLMKRGHGSHEPELRSAGYGEAATWYA